METVIDTAFVPPPPAPDSPLDPFLASFLGWLAAQEGGTVLSSTSRRASGALDLPSHFLDALLASARARGYLSAMPTRGPRGGVRLTVSGRGRDWLATRTY